VAFKRVGNRVKRFLASVRHMSPKKLLLIGLGGVLGISLLTAGVLNATSTPQFCSICHEMTPEHATWEASSHSKIACVTCHIEPGAISLVKHKISSMKQLYLHVTGTVPEAIVMPDPIKNSVCEQCHNMARTVDSSPGIISAHDKHLAQGISCVTCHAGVAHGFIKERGLNGKKDLSTWNNTKTEKAMTLDKTRLAEAACIKCHQQVNSGKKPWLENQEQIEKPAKAANNGGLHAPVDCNGCHSQSVTQAP
jgi:nitrate/TMAO reductase-like tetraheme cytochrome c subunit